MSYRSRKKIFTRRITNSEAFYNDIEDIDERPRIEIENGWTLYANSCENNDVKLPFHTIPVGVVFKGEVCITIIHQTEMLSDFVIYTNRKNKNIKIILI
jgi:magnesium transporter